MARIAGVTIPSEKRIEASLCYIYGIGPSLSKRILTETGVNADTRTKSLTSEKVNKLREVIEKNYKVGGELN